MASKSSSKKVSVLSEAKLKKESKSTGDEPITQNQMREMFSQFIEPLTEKIGRLEKSLSIMQRQFEAIKNGDSEDPALYVTTDESQSVDIASAHAEIHKEDWYKYTTSELAEELGVNVNRVTTLVKTLGLKGNSKYHTQISTGKSENSYVHKYSQDTLNFLRDKLSQQ